MRTLHWVCRGIGALATAMVVSSAAAESTAMNFTARDGGPSEAQMVTRGNGGLPGFAFVRPVLSGVLYRAGFQGGDKAHTGLSASQRDALCRAGFSAARYIDFGSKTHFGTTTCGEGNLEYGAGSSGRAGAIMRDLHAVIENPSSGPLLVHCMWGVHSSGAVAAMSLMQFCGWSEKAAKAYWDKARNNAPCGKQGCSRWIDDKFRQFKVDPALEISAETQQAICPR